MIKFSTTELLLPDHMFHYKNANACASYCILHKKAVTIQIIVQLHAAIEALHSAGD